MGVVVAVRGVEGHDIADEAVKNEAGPAVVVKKERRVRIAWISEERSDEDLYLYWIRSTRAAPSHLKTFKTASPWYKNQLNAHGKMTQTNLPVLSVAICVLTRLFRMMTWKSGMPRPIMKKENRSDTMPVSKPSRP